MVEPVRRGAVQSVAMCCPACRGSMHVRALSCAHCDLEVRGHFEGNEFATLAQEHLQLLRVFVLCEGRIRDMEKALGVSYPTVKNRITALRAQLGLADAASPAPDSEQAALAVLDALERGDLAPSDAAAALRRVRDSESS